MTPQEKTERDRTEYPHILHYRFFAREYHWTPSVVDAEDDEIMRDLQVAEYVDRELKPELQDRFDRKSRRSGAEKAWTRGMHLARVRHELELPDDLDDETVEEIIGRSSEPDEYFFEEEDDE